MPQASVLECPRCGATIPLHGSEVQVRCEYCGTLSIVPPELRTPPPAPAPVAPPPMYRPEPSFQPTPARKSSGMGCAGLLGTVVVLGLIAAIGFLSDPDIRKSVLNPDPTVAPVSRPLTVELPRQVQYANLVYKLTQAQISNEDPNPANASKKYRADRAYAYLTLNVSNPSRSFVSSGIGLIKLQLADGTFARETTTWAEGVDAQSSREARLIFSLPAGATWQGTRLVLSEAGKEPAAIPLDAPMPAAQYPVALTSGSEAAVAGIVYKITAARLDLDAEGRRIDQGKRFLHLSLHVTNKSDAAGGVAVTTGNFRLIVNGDAVAPLTAPIEALAPQSSLDGLVVFVVPATATSADFQVGEVQKATTKIPLSLQGPAR